MLAEEAELLLTAGSDVCSTTAKVSVTSILLSSRTSIVKVILATDADNVRVLVSGV